MALQPFLNGPTLTCCLLSKATGLQFFGAKKHPDLFETVTFFTEANSLRGFSWK